MQKDHLINIKDQTIDQLQRHIESLSSRWGISREIKPYVQYSMTVNPPSENTPQLVQSQNTSSHPSQNIRYQGYRDLSEPGDPMQNINFSTKPDPSLVRENDHQKGNVGVDHHHPNCSIIIKNDPQQQQQQQLLLQQQQVPLPQQPPEPLNQNVNELMSE